MSASLRFSFSAIKQQGWDARPRHSNGPIDRSRYCRLDLKSVKAEAVTDRPQWTGDTVLSNLTNALIKNPLLFGLMKIGARQQFQSIAERRGISWNGIVRELKANPDLERIYEQVKNPSVAYPDYYRQEFHGYSDGNLNWLAAYEVEPATYAMALRIWRTEEDLKPDVAHERMRNGVYEAVDAYVDAHGAREIKDIIDVACSGGVSTRSLATHYPDAQVTGIDLSPYFLAVAELREREIHGETDERTAGHHSSAPYKRIRYLHANIEESGLQEASLDLISCQFCVHELPAAATRNVAHEFKRLLRPGGVAFFVDTDPKSPVLQNLPAPLFTLMKSTEPWADEYFTLDIEACMKEAGFQYVTTVPSDPRHRVIMGIVP